MATEFTSQATPVRLSRVEPFQLGLARIEPAALRVSSEGRTLALEPRIMQVLVVLAQAENRVVSREALIESCWGGVTVGDNAIHRSISRLRSLARDLGGGGFQIETLSRVGYRLTASPGPDAGTPALAPPPSTDVLTEAKIRLCVLPFSAPLGGEDNEVLADGVAEDVITELGRISIFSVTSVRTSFALKGAGSDLRSIGAALGVSHVREGSVRRTDGRVRLSVRLVDVQRDRVVWAERYDRSLQAISALPTEVSRAMASALDRGLSPQDARRLAKRAARNPEAFELLLMARHYHRTGYAGNLRRYNTVIELCERATAIDADDAEAWALMAASQANRRRHFAIGDGGRAAVGRALALDDGLSAARAIKAQILMMDGDYDASLVEIDAALALDPDGLDANLVAGQIYFRLRRLDDAIAYWERAAALAETDFIPLGFLTACYVAQGDLERARRAARSLKLRTGLTLAEEPDNSSATGFAAYAHAVLGEAEKANRLMAEALARGEDNLQMKTAFVRTKILLDQHEAALDLLEDVLSASAAGFAVFAATDQTYDPLRGDPRFAAMLSQAIHRRGASTSTPGSIAPRDPRLSS